MSEEEPERFRELVNQANEIQQRLDPLILTLVEARRQYMRTRSDADKTAMERLEAVARELLGRHAALAPEIREASGLSPEQLALVDAGAPLQGDDINRLQRALLTAEHVQTTAYLDDGLPGALERLERLVPKGWLEQQSDEPHDLEQLFRGDQTLSLVKGLRPESEVSPLHRLRQMLRVSRDYATGARAYDHFGGALLVPQLVHLGARLDLVSQVRGDGRLERLWLGASEGVDATIFELFVALANAERGRRIEFIEESFEASADLRCYEPFPLLIECKRKRSLSDYELREEQHMRSLFALLRAAAEKRGMFGRFELRLTIEASQMPASEIVGALIHQRLSPNPERPLSYAWGTAAYMPLPQMMDLPGPTRSYSPNMLEYVFDWNSDLPKWDGLICNLETRGASVTDVARRPLALTWINESQKAIHKRSWNAVGLVGDALRQITPGEVGVIYVAQHEGARESVADRRSESFLELAHELDHPGSIRVPILFLVRHYPRPLDEGQPDLIENTVRLLSAEYGDQDLFRYFAQRIFTPSVPGTAS